MPGGLGVCVKNRKFAAVFAELIIKTSNIMRKHIVAGNWKMNTTVAEGVELAKAVVAAAAEVPADV